MIIHDQQFVIGMGQVIVLVLIVFAMLGAAILLDRFARPNRSGNSPISRADEVMDLRAELDRLRDEIRRLHERMDRQAKAPPSQAITASDK